MHLVGCRVLDGVQKNLCRREQTVQLSRRSGTIRHWESCYPPLPTSPSPKYLYRQQEGMSTLRLRSYIPLRGIPIQAYSRNCGPVVDVYSLLPTLTKQDSSKPYSGRHKPEHSKHLPGYISSDMAKEHPYHHFTVQNYK